MNIYVGNLHYEINEDFLKTVFEEYGTVESAKIIIDKYSGKSKGFGFIEMPEESEGLKAIEALNGKEVKGRNLKVNQAREKSESNFKKTPKHKSYNR
jgi:RNA recognition motif-containing protein